MGKPAAPDRPRLTPLSHSFTLEFRLEFWLNPYHAHGTAIHVTSDSHLSLTFETFQNPVRQHVFSRVGVSLAKEALPHDQAKDTNDAQGTGDTDSEE